MNSKDKNDNHTIISSSAQPSSSSSLASSSSKNKVSFIEQNISKSNEAFEDIQNYLLMQIEETCSEFKLLQSMNELCKDQYRGFNEDARTLVTTTSSLQSQFDKMEQYIKMVDDLERKVNHFEDVSKEMDQYVARLGN